MDAKYIFSSYNPLEQFNNGIHGVTRFELKSRLGEAFREVKLIQDIGEHWNMQSAFSDDPGIWVLLTIVSLLIWLALSKRIKR